MVPATCWTLSDYSHQSPGFKTFVRSGITVQVAQVLRVDIQLEVGASSESVTVSAEGSLLKTETGDVSTNVEVQTLDTLPILSTGSAAAGIAQEHSRNPKTMSSMWCPVSTMCRIRR